jgi:hypothetical protein
LICNQNSWHISQAVECLLCKHEALSSNPSFIKKKNKKQNQKNLADQVGLDESK